MTQIGPYTLQRALGSGGMADVYLAWDRAKRRHVALKVLRSAASKLIKRSEREATLLMNLRHSHIVRVYESGLSRDGRYFIAMEYVAGGGLDDLIHYRQNSGPKISDSEAVYLIYRVAEAIGYAHRAGIVHRDLKPGNILLRANSGEPVVTDLGIAVFTGANRLTGTMESLGTPQYMAPEQASSGSSVDGRADIYALGVMLYELLTGQLPFDDDNHWAILLRKREETAPSVLAARPDLDPQLATIVDACLQRNPDARPQTAEELATALKACLPTGARPPTPPPLPVSQNIATSKQQPSPLLWAIGAALALVLLLALLLPGLRPGRPQPTEIAEVTETGEAPNQTTTSASPVGPTSTLAEPVTNGRGGGTGGTPSSTTTSRVATATRRPGTSTPRPSTTPTSSSRGGNVTGQGPDTAIPTTEVSAPTFVLLEPPSASCPAGANAPSYNGNSTINFRWRWNAQPEGSNYLEVRAGPPGRGTSLGRVEPAIHRKTGGEWAFPASASTIRQNDVDGYQWRVVYVDRNGAELSSSAVSCFHIAGVTAPPTDTPTDTPIPPNPDRDNDGVPDSEDQCPDVPQGSEPDPDRPGCPAPEPPVDSDGDGIPDGDDFCPFDPPGPYPDPIFPGCPGLPPYPANANGSLIVTAVDRRWP